MSVPRKTILLAAAVVSVIVAAVAVLSPQGLPNYRRLGNEADRLRDQNAALQRENDGLREDIRGLKASERVQEKVVREDLGHVKPGEQLFIVNVPAEPPAPAPAQPGTPVP